MRKWQYTTYTDKDLMIVPATVKEIVEIVHYEDSTKTVFTAEGTNTEKTCVYWQNMPNLKKGCQIEMKCKPKGDILLVKSMNIHSRPND